MLDETGVAHFTQRYAKTQSKKCFNAAGAAFKHATNATRKLRRGKLPSVEREQLGGNGCYGWAVTITGVACYICRRGQ